MAVHVSCLCMCVFVYHVGQENMSKAQGTCGEIHACMSWECIRFQVDVIAGNGNKACSTQSRLKNNGKAAPVRVKHVISCSYKDLVLLQQNLRGIKTETYI